MGNTKREKLIKLLEKIQSTNDFECLKIYCSDLYDSIKNSNFKNLYQEKVIKFLEYHTTEGYKKDYKDLVEKLNLDITISNFPYDYRFPYFRNFDFDKNNTNCGDGLIQAYINTYQDIIEEMYYPQNFNEKLYYVDYALFEIMMNANYYDDYGEYLSQDDFFSHDILNKDYQFFDMVRIIAVKILKDFLKYISEEEIIKKKNKQHRETKPEKLKKLINKKINNQEMYITFEEIKNLLNITNKDLKKNRNQCRNYIYNIEDDYPDYKFESAKDGYFIEKKS